MAYFMPEQNLVIPKYRTIDISTIQTEYSSEIMKFTDSLNILLQVYIAWSSRIAYILTPGNIVEH